MSTAQDAAETAIAQALDPLEPDDALTALLELQALILTEQGIAPGTPEFEAVIAAYLARLCHRMASMRQILSSTTH